MLKSDILTQRGDYMQRPANFRDLGGMQAENGKKIKEHKLLRSGDFSGLNEDDKDRMLNIFKLKINISIFCKK